MCYSGIQQKQGTLKMLPGKEKKMLTAGYLYSFAIELSGSLKPEDPKQSNRDHQVFIGMQDICGNKQLSEKMVNGGKAEI